MQVFWQYSFNVVYSQMIILDKPYVSRFLLDTIRSQGFPVVDTGIAGESGLDGDPILIDEADAIELARSSRDLAIYTNSENSIGWIAEHLSFTGLPAKIELFKNKVRFRQLIKPLYPDFYFREIARDQLSTLAVDEIPMPFIIKPTAGFFSMGVRKVSSTGEWPQTVDAIEAGMRSVKDLYPQEVLSTSSFIIEQCIEGEEYAFDAYFDADGAPVILNIHKHIFSSDEDVSDRVYVSSKEIIEDNLEPFTAFLADIGKLSGVRNFPVHVELRRSASGCLTPIEVNPMRFGGWCTTADATFFAYGFNPYVYFFSGQRPDWPALLKHCKGKLYGLIVLDNSTGVDEADIIAFDYECLLRQFKKPLKLRRMDHREYPVFGFLFTETDAADDSELERILLSDLSEFIEVNGSGNRQPA